MTSRHRMPNQAASRERGLFTPPSLSWAMGSPPLGRVAMGVPQDDAAVLASARQLRMLGVVRQRIHRVAVAFVGRARQQFPLGCTTADARSG